MWYILDVIKINMPIGIQTNSKCNLHKMAEIQILDLVDIQLFSCTTYDFDFVRRRKEKQTFDKPNFNIKAHVVKQTINIWTSGTVYTVVIGCVNKQWAACLSLHAPVGIR